jgi:hypothetical protein
MDKTFMGKNLCQSLGLFTILLTSSLLKVPMVTGGLTAFENLP